MSDYKYYLITIKTRGKVYTTPDELYRHYSLIKGTMLKGTEWSDLRVFELTSSSRLHFHTVCITKAKAFNFTKHNKSRIYCHYKEFPSKDYSKIRNYLLKQVPTRERQEYLLECNYFQNENMFNIKRPIIFPDNSFCYVHPIR